MEMKSVEELSLMEKEEIKKYLGNYFYYHALIFERLEGAGLIKGNGHHIAQHFADLAQNELIDRWIK